MRLRKTSFQSCDRRALVGANFRRVFALALLCTIGLGVCQRQTSAQTKKNTVPERELISLITKDGLILKANYYPPYREDDSEKNAGKKTVPVLLLHDYKQDKNAYDPLARSLQKRGFAVLAPDLRGHGESTSFQNPRMRKIKATRMRPQDFTAILKQDMPAIRKFLIEKNDQGELNLNRWCIIGSEMGAAVATMWAANDWSWPSLPSVKQGRDVKSLILISPVWNFRGLNIRIAQEHPAIRSDRVAMFILAGKENSRSLRDAKRLYSAIEPHHSKPKNKADHNKKYLLRYLLPTSLQGTKMLEEMSKAKELKVMERIGDFVEWRSAEPDFEWSRRVKKR